jgi:hypothetical protein
LKFELYPGYYYQLQHAITQQLHVSIRQLYDKNALFDPMYHVGESRSSSTSCTSPVRR